ncbi:membrane protein YdbS with pleckstrin-like domain [Bacillus pakistanensis]|uniref:Membrane protein YdbS with pleckstrin-like domain n=1 Tax=Rossellomorea pakistanensis TaxID=992288 RepID=A0ABS2N7U2_9BACI|nr:PH domain-containing protein [Bacillus pakistanensis]MBM7583676.1 membrane protein YdbS with pleckstrin-like domain [Bacillus pakistanensis]
MNYTLPEPQQQISQDAVKVWRVSAVITHVISIVILCILLFLDSRYDWYEWLKPVIYILIAIDIIYSIYGIVLYPYYLQKTWRYEVDERFIQLKHGALERENSIIPMTKVQYVNTNQGPILRKYNLCTITIGTTASSHKIPAITREAAEVLRTKIAIFAQIKEDE